MISLPFLLAVLGNRHATTALAPLLDSQRQSSASAVGMDATEIFHLVVTTIVVQLLSNQSNSFR
jgi:hypothetical protein